METRPLSARVSNKVYAELLLKAENSKTTVSNYIKHLVEKDIQDSKFEAGGEVIEKANNENDIKHYEKQIDILYKENAELKLYYNNIHNNFINIALKIKDINDVLNKEMEEQDYNNKRTFRNKIPLKIAYRDKFIKEVADFYKRGNFTSLGENPIIFE